MSLVEFWWLYEPKRQQIHGGLTKDQKRSLYEKAFGPKEEAST